jgi:hypothetical protein
MHSNFRVYKGRYRTAAMLLFVMGVFIMDDRFIQLTSESFFQPNRWQANLQQASLPVQLDQSHRGGVQDGVEWRMHHAAIAGTIRMDASSETWSICSRQKPSKCQTIGRMEQSYVVEGEQVNAGQWIGVSQANGAPRSEKTHAE